MKQLLKSIFVASFAFAFFTSSAYAHVTVNPREATIGYSVATVRVPNEKNVPTTSVRVLVPDGVTVGGIKPVPGWTAAVVREDSQEQTEGETGHEHEATGRITEITWSGGLINPSEFQEFPLSVQYTKEGTVDWKAYQTYQDGEVVPWDGSSEEYPASTVIVMEEAKVDTLSNSVHTLSQTQANDPMKWLSVAAILLSAAALFVSLRKK